MKYRNIRIKLLSVVSVFVTQLSVAETPPPLSDPLNTGGWVINPNATDEFNGTDIDRNVWWIQGENGNWNGQWRGRAPSEYDPDNVKVENGYLYLTSRWDPTHNYSSGNGGGNSQGSAQYGDVPITTAALLGKHFFKYGYMEMRSKAADGPISSSYWTTGEGGETDAFESFGWNPNNPWSGRRFHTSFHDWRNGSPTYGKRIWENDHIFDFRVADDFHTYGFEWDPNYVAVYIDGAMVNCVTRSEMGNAWVANNKQRAWIDMETFDWEVNADTLKSEHFNGMEGIDFVVDYARVYQRSGGGSGGTCPDRDNIIKNPSFENGMDSWSGSATIIDSSASEGSRAAALTSAGTIEQTVSVKPNTSYILSAWANSVNTNERDLWYNAFLGVKDYGSTPTNVRYFFPRWHEKSLQFTTGPDTHEATIFFTNDPQGELTYLDELALYEVDFDFSGPSVNNVSLSPSTLNILQRESGKVTASFTPSNAGNKGLLWSSSDVTVATVDNVGNIRALAPGVITITARSADNTNAVATATVTVMPNLNLLDNGNFEKGSLTDWFDNIGLVESTDQSLNVFEGTYSAIVKAAGSLKQQFPIEPNSTYRVSAFCRIDSPSPSKPTYFVLDGWEADPWGIKMEPSDFQSYSYWEQEFVTSASDSGNMAIAVWNSEAVSSNGVPQHPQTVYCDNFEVRDLGAASFEPVTGVSIAQTSDIVHVGESTRLTATVTPNNATNKTVSWISSAPNVANVNSGGLVTGVAVGESLITVKTEEGSFVDSFKVIVNAAAPTPTTTPTPTVMPIPSPVPGGNCDANWVPVTGIAITSGDVSMKIGEQVTLNFDVLPLCASQKEVTFQSTSWGVVVPNRNGVLTAKRKGTVVITGKTKDGGFTDSITVVVE